MSVIALGEPRLIIGDVRIRFRGQGKAHFRLRHARDLDGEPDPLDWCDVSMISDLTIEEPEKAVDPRTALVGLLVDHVNGDIDIVYRRHNANWLQVLAAEEDDEEALKRCQAYTITISPA
jgi:hypothetical protein